MIYDSPLAQYNLHYSDRVEIEEIKRATTTQVMNIISKVPEIVVHLKIDEDLWKATKEVRGRWAKSAPNLPVKILHPNAP